MSFQKFQANYIFNGIQILPSNFVLICDDTGKVLEITEEQEAGEDIRRFKGLLTPGFVNCHCHLELSHLSGLVPEKTGLVNFVFSIVSKRNFPENKILDAARKAESEMKHNGIVAVGDICNTLHTLELKQEEQLSYYNFIEVSGWLPEVAEERFKTSYDHYKSFSTTSNASLVPHAPYSVSQKLWQLIKPLYQDKIVSIHNQETDFEDELFIQNTGDFIRMYELMNFNTSFYTPSGKSSLQTYFSHLSKAGHIILVHNTFTKAEDIIWVKEQRPSTTLSFCLCVNANLYIEQAIPPVDLLRKNDCNIVLGTDSLASNWSLSILDEMKTINKHFQKIPLEELLTWATLNGAKALQMDDVLGSFEKEKRPGVVLLENLDLINPVSMQQTTARRLI